MVFLLALIALDSFKLVRFRWVFLAIILGSVMAFSTLWLGDWLPRPTEVVEEFRAPIIEETLKAAFLVFLIARKRVGFMVDATIFGFALGAGFALVENVHYFKTFPEEPTPFWAVRGFGTAVMHGLATSTMGIVSKQLSDRFSGARLHLFVPGLLLAFLIHGSYNHFLPHASPIGITLALPLVILVVFRASARVTRNWLGVRFDTDSELLEMIKTGRITESRVGTYLKTLQSRFPGEVVADMLCILRLHLELSIRAKGMLLMREAGFEVQREPQVEASFRELKFLEKSIGKTGMLAIKPVLNYGERDLWQLHMVGQQG
jgi:RsiW-degrading membrane proteinase PrsW (M82 family)